MKDPVLKNIVCWGTYKNIQHHTIIFKAESWANFCMLPTRYIQPLMDAILLSAFCALKSSNNVGFFCVFCPELLLLRSEFPLNFRSDLLSDQVPPLVR